MTHPYVAYSFYFLLGMAAGFVITVLVLIKKVDNDDDDDDNSGDSEIMHSKRPFGPGFIIFFIVCCVALFNCNKAAAHGYPSNKQSFIISNSHAINALLIIPVAAVALFAYMCYKMYKQEKTAFYDDIDEDDGNDVKDFGKSWHQTAESPGFTPASEEDFFFYVDPKGDLKVDFLHPI